MIRDQIHRDAMEIKPLATTENCRQDLVRFGRSEDKFHVRRWFFQGLQQGIEGGLGEHVDLVDDIDFEMTFAGKVTNVVTQFSNLVDVVIARAVDLQDVQAVSGGDFLTTVTNSARSDRWSMNAVKRFRQNASGRCLSDPSWTDEEVSMR